MKSISVFMFFLLTLSLSGQNTKQSDRRIDNTEITDNYDRISFTYLLLDTPSGSYYDMLKQSFQSFNSSQDYKSDKYDANTISDQIVKLSPQSINSEQIQSALVTGHVGNAIIAKWFSRKNDGSFGVELMHQRGLYNATDGDIKNANATKRGMSTIKDAGEKLINNSFIIVYKVDDLIDMNEYYNRQQQKSKTPVERYKNGFIANVTAYIYKIDFNESIKNIFFEKHWAYPGDSDILQKKQAFDIFQFPLKFYASTNMVYESSQWNPGYSTSPLVQVSREIQMLWLVKGSVNKSIAYLEDNFGQFKTTTSLYKTWPLRAKIGKKENLDKDDRFFVFQMEQGSSGKVIGKRKGVIRANKIVDNRQVATGQSELSRFYQVSGGNLKKGMLLQQKNDRGGAFSLGVTQGGVSGIDARAEINLTQWIWPKLPSMSKFYIEGSFQPVSLDAKYDDGSITTYNYFFRYGNVII